MKTFLSGVCLAVLCLFSCQQAYSEGMGDLDQLPPEMRASVCQWLEPNHLGNVAAASKGCNDFIVNNNQYKSMDRFQKNSPKWRVIHSFKEYHRLRSLGYIDLSAMVLEFDKNQDTIAFLSDSTAHKDVRNLEIHLGYPRAFAHVDISLLKNFKKLERLSIRNKLDSRSTCRTGIKPAVLAAVLEDLKALTSFEFSDYCGQEDIVSVLAPTIGKLTGLTRLKLETPNNHEGRFLISEIGNLSKLTHLDLSLNDGEYIELIPELDKLSKLTHLGLSKYNPPEEVVEIAKRLAPKIGALKSLNYLKLTIGELNSEVVGYLAPAIGGLSKLTHLDLSGGHLTAKGAEHLAPAIGGLTNLRYLDLRWIGLSAKGAKHLAPAIGGLSKLTYLDLSDNGLTEEGAALLVPEIGKLTKLTYLNLSSIGLGKNAGELLANEINKLSQLEQILLEGHNIAETAEALVPAIGKLKNLKLVKLQSDELNSELVDALVLHIGNLSKLRHLVITGDAYGWTAGKPLKAALRKINPRLKIRFRYADNEQ